MAKKPTTIAEERPTLAVWTCKIGGVAHSSLPEGCDAQMRKAVIAAYTKLTGQTPEFCFTGWGGKLDAIEEVFAYPPKPASVYPPKAKK